MDTDTSLVCGVLRFCIVAFPSSLRLRRDVTGAAHTDKGARALAGRIRVAPRPGIWAGHRLMLAGGSVQTPVLQQSAAVPMEGPSTDYGKALVSAGYFQGDWR